MEETQKPFACPEKDCEMTFTNEDHLNWHQKKHDMMLNLGLAKNNDVADQTPTPTRFIRNCEEVGLFQDLQNVNPFDEFFKKAVETTKAGGTLVVPETNSDDTLHTPHILPHIEENQKKISSATNQDDNNSQSNDFSLNNVIPITTSTENTSEQDKIAECVSTSVIVIDDDSTDEYDVKMKIREALQNKEKQKNEKENFTNSAGANPVIVVENQDLAKDMQNETVENEKLADIREKIREMNRAAQVRCRKRKQNRWKDMEKEIYSLKQENKKLRTENYNLRTQLWQMLEKGFSPNSVTETAQSVGRLIPVTESLLPVVQNQKTSNRETGQGRITRTLIPRVPNQKISTKEVVQSPITRTLMPRIPKQKTSTEETVQGSITRTLIPIMQNQKTSETGPCPAALIAAIAAATSHTTLNNNGPHIPHPVVVQIFPNGSTATVPIATATVPVATNPQPDSNIIKIKTESGSSLTISPNGQTMTHLSR